MENQNYQPVNLPQSNPAPIPPSQTPPPAPPAPPAPQGGGHKSKVGLIAVVAFILLVFGGVAYAFLFTDLKYKIPWLRPDESELVNLMYDRVAMLDGADFSVEYNLYVADRDNDIKEGREPRVSQSEARNRSYKVQSALNNMKPYLTRCLNEGGEIVYEGKKVCNGGDDSKPKAKESACNSDGATAVWPDLSGYEWEYQGNCLFDENDLGSDTWSFSAKAKYNGDIINCNETSCSIDREINRLDYDTSEALQFAAGDYFLEILEELENQIPNNFNAKIEFSGKGFSISDRFKGEKYLPDIEVGLKGEADLSSLNIKVDMSAKVIDDKVYYKVENFPMIDITEGHMGEWIEMDTENSDWFMDEIPEYQEEQKQVLDDFRKFIAGTKDYDILEFVPNGKTIEVDGVKNKLFDVQVNAENIPDWLVDAARMAKESQERNLGSDLMKIKDTELSPEEKEAIVNYINKSLSNIRVTAGISTNTGDLMYLQLFSRILPTADSKKFADKQFNSVLTFKVWNHNDPSKIEKPDDYVSYDIIDMEKKNLNEEEYYDYKQSLRVLDVRNDLERYYNENKKYPESLKEATRQYKDLVTGKDYKYSVNGNNYSLIYSMETNTIPPGQTNSRSSGVTIDDWGVNELDTVYLGDPYSSNSRYKRFYDYSALESTLYWHDGENEADRYSVVADQHKKSNKLVVSGDYTDYDVYKAAMQSRMVKSILNRLKSIKNSKTEYPDTIDSDTTVTVDNGWGFYDYTFDYCEDLLTGNPCDYKVIDNGKDFELKVNFGMDSADIAKSLSTYNYLNTFDKGLNTFTQLSTVEANKDTDRDGLLDIDELRYGTDINNKDTDGDGFYDGEEVEGGYNPLGPGLLGQNNTQEEQGEKISGFSAPDFTKDWYRGDKNAQVTIITFSDLDCPFCAKFHTTMGTVLDNYQGDVNWVYRHFPLDSLHPDAKTKAHAAECVGKTKGNVAFWTFIDDIFANSETVNDLSTYAVSAGVDATTFSQCQDSLKYISEINSDTAEAQAAGGRGTPFSVVVKGGKKVAEIPGALPYESIKSILDQYVN